MIDEFMMRIKKQSNRIENVKVALFRVDLLVLG